MGKGGETGFEHAGGCFDGRRESRKEDGWFEGGGEESEPDSCLKRRCFVRCMEWLQGVLRRFAHACCLSKKRYVQVKVRNLCL